MASFPGIEDIFPEQFLRDFAFLLFLSLAFGFFAMLDLFRPQGQTIPILIDPVAFLINKVTVIVNQVALLIATRPGRVGTGV